MRMLESHSDPYDPRTTTTQSSFSAPVSRERRRFVASV